MAHAYEQLIHDVQTLLAHAEQKGLDHAEISAAIESGFSVNARLGDVETVEHHKSNSVSLTVYRKQRMASVHLSDLSPSALSLALEKARVMVQYTNEDPYSGLADASLMAYDYPDLSLHHPWEIDPPAAIKMAIDCETRARQYDARITNSEGASVNTFTFFKIYANSHGFLGSYTKTNHSINCSVIAEESGHMQCDSEYTAAHDPKKLVPPEVVANQVAEKTVRRLGAKKISTRVCPVIFHAPVARNILRSFVNSISGGNLYRGTTFLKDCLGESVFPKFITIHQDPHLPNEMGSAPFDAEGVRTQELKYVDKGVLVNYVLGSYSARKLGLQTTGNAGGVHNLFVNTSQKNLNVLLKEMGRGLLITDLMGQGVNITTGDFSRGAFGFWIENGEIQHPVEEITIASNLRDMFRGVQLVGNDVDYRSNIKTGSILINQMTIAGN